MKTSAAVIAALFASVEAINIRQLAFMKAQEQLNGPAVGNEFPRFCELGAPAPGSDVNSQGCMHQVVPPNVRSAPRAVASPPIGGDVSLNYNNQTPSTAPASEPRPNQVRNLADSPNGSVSIGFAYVQTKGVGEVPDVEPKRIDPSKAATEDPIKLANELKAAANVKEEAHEGAEKEQKEVKDDPEIAKRVEKEEAQSKASGAAVKLLLAPKEEPKESGSSQGAWDQRASNDAARGEAAKAVASQVADETAKVAENKKIVAEATDATAKSTNINSRNREGVAANSWHEYWVTKVVPQPFGDSYSADRQLRAGEPTKEEKEAAKANGPSEKEQKAEDDAKKDAAAAAAPAAPSLAQLKSKAKGDPSKADAEEAAYQKVWEAEQTRLKAAEKTLADQITANEKFRAEHAVTLSQKKASLAQVKEDPSKADAEEAAYQKVWEAEQTRMKAAEKTLADQITANEKFRAEHAVTLAQHH